MIPIDKIENTETCFLQLWLMLDNTRMELMEQYKRYTISNILKSWFGSAATDDFIWEVCTKSGLMGLDELPPPEQDPYPHRFLLQAIVSVCMHIGLLRVNLHALDTAYSIAFPTSTPLNINKNSTKGSEP